MKLLFVVPYAPSRIRVRPDQLIRSLAGQGHDITLATLWETDEEQESVQRLAQYCGRILMQPLSRWQAIGNSVRAFATPQPLQAAYCWQPALAHDITELLEQSAFDVVHVEHLRGARYGLVAKTKLASQQRTTPVVWDSVDCISHLFQQAIRHSRSLKARLMTQFDLARTRRYEGWLVRQFERVLVTSAADRQALAALAQPRGLLRSRRVGTHLGSGSEVDGHLEVVANGVDLAYFALRSEEQGAADIVFTGKMSYHANVTAALYLVHEIMPQVWAQRPDARVWLVGKQPPPEIRRLAAMNGDLPRVVVTGTVTDIRPYLCRATVAVAPLVYGAGIQNKLLEAMATGVPIVSSPQAASGLGAQGAMSLRVADSASTFAATIMQLLNSKEARSALGMAGRRYVEEHHTWPQVAAQVTEIYRTAIAAKQRAVHAPSL